MADLSLTKLPWKIQLAVFAVVALASAGAFYYWYEMPEREVIASREREVGNIRARINKGLATARQLPEFRKQVDELRLRLDSLRPILPEEKDVADLLRRINTLATQSNLTVRGFKPLAINTREMHAEWPITLELEGTYHNLGLFLDRVSKFPRIINVGKLEIQGKQQPTPSTTIDVSCTATTFVLIDAPAAGGKKGAPPPAPKKS